MTNRERLLNELRPGEVLELEILGHWEYLEEEELEEEELEEEELEEEELEEEELEDDDDAQEGDE